jgi:hypothetical protein
LIASTLPDLSEVLVTVVSCCVRQAEVVADRNGIRPPRPLRRAVGGGTGALGEARQEVDRFWAARLQLDRSPPLFAGPRDAETDRDHEQPAAHAPSVGQSRADLPP